MKYVIPLIQNVFIIFVYLTKFKYILPDTNTCIDAGNALDGAHV